MARLTWHRGWIPPHVPTNLGSSGPTRVQTAEVVDDTVVTRPAGFKTLATALVRGEVAPPPRIRVWLGKRSGWWRWSCPACPHNIGGFCPTWRAAYDAGLKHRQEHQ